MDVEISEICQITQLTKTSKETGEIYYRRDEVAAQIIKIGSLKQTELLETLADLQSETLVFLFRKKAQSDREISGKLWEILSERIFKIARRQRTYLR